MKLILFLIYFSFTLPIYAHYQKDTLQQKEELLIIPSSSRNRSDTTKKIILRNSSERHKENTINELFIIGRNAYKIGKNKGGHAPFKGHWTGFHYGFVNFAHLPEEWNALELDWGHSFSMQFNIFKYNINLVPQNNFGLVTGMGLEYQRLRFNNDNISIAKRNGKLDIIHSRDEYSNIESIKRSTFKVLYLTIPLVMEIQFPARNTHRMYVSGGLMGGVRMHSKTKIVYKDKNGDKYRKKDKGNFNMVPFKADAIARIGYRNVNVWGSYTLTNMFKSSDTPDLHLYTIGLGLTF